MIGVDMRNHPLMGNRSFLCCFEKLAGSWFVCCRQWNQNMGLGTNFGKGNVSKNAARVQRGKKLVHRRQKTRDQRCFVLERWRPVACSCGVDITELTISKGEGFKYS